MFMVFRSFITKCTYTQLYWKCKHVFDRSCFNEFVQDISEEEWLENQQEKEDINTDA